MRFEDYKNPKTLDKPLTKRDEEFVSGLVDHKLSAVEAFTKAGYKGKSQKVFKHRANRTQRYLWPHIEERIRQKVGETATMALGVLEQLLQSDSDNVRLNAARDILSRAGYDAVHKQETVLKEVSELSDEELDEKIAQVSNVIKLPKTDWG